MRLTIAATVAALMLSSAASAQEGLFQRDHGKVDAPVALERPAGVAPPEGVGPGGFDFGMWRGTNPGAYGESLQAKLRTREGGKSLAAVRADLEANGFSCLEASQRAGARAPALECRLAIEDRNCGVEWWAVLEEPAAAVKAGHDRMCLPQGRR